MTERTTGTNLQVRLAARPKGLPKDSDFQLTEEAIPQPGEGEILVRNTLLSLDPAMRGWMNDVRSYVPPIGIGEVMRGLTVGEVVDSRHPDFSPGDAVTGVLGWQRFAVARGKDLTRIPPEVPPRLAMGPLGMTGMTAYFGLLEVGAAKAGDTVLVSGAGGAVGSMVGQIARIRGCRSVGIAGTDEKCRWVTEELGFDAAINYKTTPDLHEEIRRTCPQGVDVYFDNVGGDILDTALRNLAMRARVVICGAISQYNATEPAKGPSNYMMLLVQRARMEGFLVFDYVARFPEAQAEMGRWIAEGKLRHREDVVEGLENAPRALLRLFDGSNMGKLVVRI
ncbi:MAG TPA: NADP-dependent oxidoreductase [Thermoanaerobaculia bacterium]|nr:NADP-dependent oxidoreductase [Thermoanaerobaculia bacterium]